MVDTTEEKLVTSRLLEAYLACPTKCFLKSIREVAPENTFAIWIDSRNDSYRREGAKRLLADLPREIDVGRLEKGRLENAQWQFAPDQVLQARNLESIIHVVQRIPLEGADKSSQFVPIRFVPANKLSRADRLMAGFDALVLSKVLGVTVGLAKIVHGDNWSTFKVKTKPLLPELRKVIGKITALFCLPRLHRTLS